jgi:hypothetical protein
MLNKSGRTADCGVEYEVIDPCWPGIKLLDEPKPQSCPMVNFFVLEDGVRDAEDFLDGAERYDGCRSVGGASEIIEE